MKCTKPEWYDCKIYPGCGWVCKQCTWNDSLEPRYKGWFKQLYIGKDKELTREVIGKNEYWVLKDKVCECWALRGEE